jgi:iron complex transport system ATP-binding protein
MNAVLNAEGISVRIGGCALLDGVTLELHAGEVCALMGENGAGKSTLLKVCAGDTAPDSGRVELAGRSVRAWPTLERARLRAVLPQDTHTSFAFTAEEVVLLGRAPHCDGYPRRIDREIAAAALSKLDARHLANRIFATLSGGERARVSLARVLAQLWTPWQNHPRLLLLDEPVAALDIAHQHLTLKVAREFAAAGVAVLAVLHDLNLAAQYAHRTTLLKSARVLASGATDAVLTEEILERCFATPIRRLAHPGDGRALLVAA